MDEKAKAISLKFFKNQGGNDGSWENQGGNVENQGGNAGNIIEIEKTKWRSIKSYSLFLLKLKKMELPWNVNICFMKLET